ncbi:MAG: DUF3105 domain-containing protein [Actinobacteria bacterium]|nr:DUF3105 domain-containing protein [Actinomycetota bacterium]
MSQKLDKGQSKKLQEKQRKRLAEQARKAQQSQASRRSNLVTAGIAAVVVVAVVALVLSDRPSTPSVSIPDGVAASAAGCNDVEQFAEQSRDHIDVGAEHDPYNSTPPTSGPHYGTPADPGFYPNPLEPEQLLHNLEHGQLVIWYDPQASASAVEGIQALVEDANSRAQRAGFVEPLLAAPFEGLDSGFDYSLSGWRNLQSCESYSRTAIDDFRTEFQGRGPEQVGVAPFGS